MRDKTNLIFAFFLQLCRRIVGWRRHQPRGENRQIKIFYQGDVGKGKIMVAIPELADFNQLIEIFHTQTGKPPTYSIKAGAPPNRRSITVGYDYQIKVNHTNVIDFSTPIRKLIKNKNEPILIEVSGGGKCD